MENNDSKTTIEELRNRQMEFVKERHWQKFQNMRSIAISLSLEANELLDYFQRLNDSEVLELEKNKEKINELSEEIADILAYLLIASDRLEIDLSETLRGKISKNRLKYPKEESHNLSWKEDNTKYQKLHKDFKLKKSL